MNKSQTSSWAIWLRRRMKCSFSTSCRFCAWSVSQSWHREMFSLLYFDIFKGISYSHIGQIVLISLFSLLLLLHNSIVLPIRVHGNLKFLLWLVKFIISIVWERRSLVWRNLLLRGNTAYVMKGIHYFVDILISMEEVTGGQGKSGEVQNGDNFIPLLLLRVEFFNLP